MYLTIAEAKKHLNVDFSNDDDYIGALIESAEDAIQTYINRPLTDVMDGEALRPSIKHAIKLLVANWYDNREAVSHTNTTTLGFALEFILLPLKKFGK